METRRLATIVRRLGDTRTRRGALGGALLALTAAGLPLSGAEAQARKRGKKGDNDKKKCPPKPKCPPNPNPNPTPSENCQEACPARCGSCLHRKVDSLLCSNGFEAGLERCSTDSDCVGVKFGNTFFPYCVTQTEARANGQIDDVVDGTGFCTNALTCSAA